MPAPIPNAFLAYLTAELDRRRRGNPAYSIRAFALVLGIDSSTLAKVLNGVRPITPRMGSRILGRLRLDKKTKRELLQSLHPEFLGGESFEGDVHTLSDGELSLLDGWESFAILSLFETRDFRSHPTWIAHRLGIEPERARYWLDNLKSAGLIRETRNGLKLTGVSTRISREKNAREIHLLHLQYLDRAREMIVRDTLSDCLFTGVTMAVSTKKREEARRRIVEFQRSFAAYLCADSAEAPDTVFRLNIQLFPLVSSPDETSSARPPVRSENSVSRKSGKR